MHPTKPIHAPELTSEQAQHPDFETYTNVLQALMSCQERINNYRRMITELTEVLEKLESLNGYYLSCIIAREAHPSKE